MEHMDVYTKFTDSIFKRIEWNAELDETLKKSKELLLKIQKRDLYKFIGETLLPKGKRKDSESKIRGEILKCCKTAQERKSMELNLIVDRVKINYGMGDKNPVDHVLFYLRNDNDSGGYLSREQVSCFIPQIFEECYIRVYCKTTEKNVIERSKELFAQWIKSE